MKCAGSIRKRISFNKEEGQSGVKIIRQRNATRARVVRLCRDLSNITIFRVRFLIFLFISTYRQRSINKHICTYNVAYVNFIALKGSFLTRRARLIKIATPTTQHFSYMHIYVRLLSAHVISRRGINV